ncbi:MAG: carbonic anhydrase [Methylophilaceae bacterium]
MTTLKPLKVFQRFPIVDVVNQGHTIQANFKPGNILFVDGVMYQMKYVNFHAPSENQIMGKSFLLEAHFVHADPKGNLAVLAVMFDEDHENKALAKLWKQLPIRKGKPKKMVGKVLAGNLLPRKKEYYRFSGSLTTPPCKEGVVWVVVKTIMTVSKQQISALKQVIRKDNNRPIQDLNGRVVVE